MNGLADVLCMVDDVLESSGFRSNPYFGALRDGTFSHSEFLETQRQFHAAVVHFSRPMAALASRIPEPGLRVELLRNVWEEHGEGNGHDSHGATFVRFLSRLSRQDEAAVVCELAAQRTWPEVQGFNTLLDGACSVTPWPVGAATLGIIERMFAEISGWIGQATVERGWMAAGNMVHYSLHAALDVRHAKDFFDVLGHAWEAEPGGRMQVQQGLWMGAVAFDGLYQGLYRARARRWGTVAP